jgi:hypothetical protein
MLVHARYAVAWPQLAAGLLLVVVAVEEAGRDPWRMWPLQGVAVAVLVAVAAWCLDEPVPEVARTTPRQLGWSLGPRALGLVPTLALWVAAVLLVGGGMFGRRADVVVQGVVAVAAVVGGVALARSLGAPRPARWVVRGPVPLLVAVSLLNPVPERLPVFPYAPTGQWEGSRWLWTAVGMAGLGALALGLGEAGWWRIPHGRTDRADTAPGPLR